MSREYRIYANGTEDWSLPFFFYAGDRHEPPHVHVEREDKLAKFWIDPIRLKKSGGFNRMEMARIQKIINEHQATLLEAWNDYFSD